ncbi:hypothetical protein [Salidesulfovibrio onnuriiensis]|uniref:hypothetical protein n=1 Tax=Salidesulfovibrio onnuriiensis TaxID=2583823 RepID=UPI0011CAABF1|nr:hypothetical protein [Salidesulfovibrio onnuriiensis]
MKRFRFPVLLLLFSLLGCTAGRVDFADLDIVPVTEPVEYRYAPVKGKIRLTTEFTSPKKRTRVVSEFFYASELKGDLLQWSVDVNLRSPDVNSDMNFDVATDVEGNVVTRRMRVRDGVTMKEYAPGSEKYLQAEGLFRMIFIPVVYTKLVSRDVISQHSPLVPNSVRNLLRENTETTLLGRTTYRERECYVIRFHDSGESVGDMDGKRIKAKLKGFLLVDAETLAAVAGESTFRILDNGVEVLRGESVAEEME